MSGSGGDQDKSDFLKSLQEAINPKSSKSKLTEMLKHTISTVIGLGLDLPQNAKVLQRWKDLDDARGDEHATMVKVREHLEEVWKDLGIKPKGQLLQYKLFKKCSKGSLTQHSA